MLLLKVVVALSVYQHYCVGSYIHHGDYEDEVPIDNEIWDEPITVIVGGLIIPPKEDNVTDGEDFSTNLEEILRADDEFTSESHENQSTDDEATNDDENQTDGELTTEPDENPTTDGELTTEPDENPTTESGECPPDKSIYSKKDIRAIIDFIFNDLGLKESMTEYVVPEAKIINQKLSEDFHKYENEFLKKPDHLKDVLQGVSAVRKQTIEPEAQKIADILKDYPQVKENIDEKQLKFKKLNKKLNKYENLCKYTCEDEESEPSRIFKRSITEEHLCSSIADLHKQIKTELSENFDGFLYIVKMNLLTINQTFSETIETFKTKLKERALNEFGDIMYNVLNLEKEYHSFVNDMKSPNTQILMYDVKEGALQIDSKLLELQKLIENYGDYCRNCNKGPLKRSVRHTKLQININEKSKVSIVNELIQEKYNESEKELYKIIEDTFKDLKELIYDPKIIEKYLEIIKLKQNEIMEAANIERQNLEHLKSTASPASIKKLSDLDSFSKDLLKDIDGKITYLRNIVY